MCLLSDMQPLLHVSVWPHQEHSPLQCSSKKKVCVQVHADETPRWARSSPLINGAACFGKGLVVVPQPADQR